MSKWSDIDVDWLIENRTKGIDYCAEYLGRTYGSVSGKLFSLRLASKHTHLKESVKSHRKVVSEVTTCQLPVFHPVMVGLFPVTVHSKRRMWRERRRIVLKMHDNLCVYCGDEADTVDHIIPRDQGGIDNKENLVAACARCNYSFGNKTKHIVWIDTSTRSSQGSGN